MKTNSSLKKTVKIRVRNEKWTIKFITSEYMVNRIMKKEDMKEFGTKPLHGLCDGGIKTIFVNIDDKYEEVCDTLFHELTHAFLSITWDTNSENSKNDEELVAKLLGSGLSQMAISGTLEKIIKIVKKLKNK